jgi:hypothetical protein
MARAFVVSGHDPDHAVLSSLHPANGRNVT